MQFINEVADVVHHITDEFNGSTNKNIGDAFLLVWKVPTPSSLAYSRYPLTVRRRAVQSPHDITRQTKQSFDFSPGAKTDFMTQRTAELALAAAIKILVRIESVS